MCVVAQFLVVYAKCASFLLIIQFLRCVRRLIVRDRDDILVRPTNSNLQDN